MTATAPKSQASRQKPSAAAPGERGARRWRWLLTRVGLLAAVVAVVWQGSGLLQKTSILPPDDFIEYWAAGRLNASGQDPYLPAALLALEAAAGRPSEQAVMMWNPPWTLTLAMPLGMLPSRAAQLLWLVLNFCAVAYAADRMWRFYGGAADRRWVALLLAFAFAPTLFVLGAGQIGPVLLLGVVGFLVFERTGRDLWAGASTVLIAIKPHLFVVFWIVLALWIWSERRWKVLAGGLLAAAAALVPPLLCNPSVLQQYVIAARTHPPEQWVSPTLGSMLRYAMGVEHFRLQFVPLLVALAFVTAYWLRHQGRNWNWGQHAPLLVLVSFVTAPYGAWPFDLVVLLLAVLHSAAQLASRREDRFSGWAIAAYAIINVVALGMNFARVSSFCFIWMSPALLILYVVAGRHMGAIRRAALE